MAIITVCCRKCKKSLTVTVEGEQQFACPCGQEYLRVFDVSAYSYEYYVKENGEWI